MLLKGYQVRVLQFIIDSATDKFDKFNKICKSQSTISFDGWLLFAPKQHLKKIKNCSVYFICLYERKIRSRRE